MNITGRIHDVRDPDIMVHIIQWGDKKASNKQKHTYIFKNCCDQYYEQNEDIVETTQYSQGRNLTGGDI